MVIEISLIGRPFLAGDQRSANGVPPAEGPARYSATCVRHKCLQDKDWISGVRWLISFGDTA